jgi:hypothetical protein
MTPLTIRADTPREAVEEVCKWLEAEASRFSRVYRDYYGADALETAFVNLKAATIEPKEQADG